MTLMLGGQDLGEYEMLVLLAFPNPQARLTIGQLGCRTSLPPDALMAALDSLTEKRVIARLNTVIESYAQRRNSTAPVVTA